MAFVRYFAVFDSADLNVMRRVFNQLCKERRLALKDGEQREALARDVICLFRQGVTAEAALWQRLSKLRRARNSAENFEAPKPGGLAPFAP
ncbi:hypothetical protein RB623_02695 [Mesorhizobium sp. LHD-90]|uniref:hypothetical protein n=1 Tax=Mesorhizobium sp. LHD-90 TaxID=3071414 RepID=UPI0027E1300D|nr:hypothetical protein [Mesorhizobium sp. LHD-90]MDQ6432961.1 hypothetical protein [Mesorhizobium sp. LHD-90]